MNLSKYGLLANYHGQMNFHTCWAYNSKNFVFQWVSNQGKGSFFDLTKDDDENGDQKEEPKKKATMSSSVKQTERESAQVLLRITEEPQSPNANGVYAELQTRIAIDQSSGSSAYEYRLCRGCEITFYEQKTDYTCSYVSLMMVTSALLSHSPEYRRCLFNGCNQVPDVISIQRLIEISWKSGFDQEGRDHFRGKLVDKRERIGPSDIAGLLRSNGIPTIIYDFDYGSQDTFRSALALIEHILFAKEESDFPIFPLIMGDAHHTIVIVGCRRHKSSGQVEVLCFDPARRISRCLAASGIEGFLFREPRTPQLQILQFGPSEEHPSLLLTEQSHESKFGGKTLFAIRPPRVSNAPKLKREKFSNE